MRRRFIVALMALATLPLAAQELNCTVEVNAQQVQNVSSTVFPTLQEAISEYMNTTQFSDAQFAVNERIECRMFFTVADYKDGTVSGTLQVQAIRPVYNSSYTTTLVNFKDSKIDFSYSEGEPLVFSQTTMESQLTAVLNFYAYLFLAMDFDSFSPRGGEDYWSRIKQIVQDAQSSGEVGWKAFEDNKNRSAVLSAYTDPATQQLRDLTYTYHRNGLDLMSQSPEKGRANITECLDILKNIYDVSPMSVGLSMTKDAKLDELGYIYSKAQATERTRVYETLYPLYPTETTRLNRIKTGIVK